MDWLLFWFWAQASPLPMKDMSACLSAATNIVSQSESAMGCVNSRTGLVYMCERVEGKNRCVKLDHETK